MDEKNEMIEPKENEEARPKAGSPSGGRRSRQVEQKRELARKKIEEQRKARQKALRIKLIGGGIFAVLLILCIIVLIARAGKRSEEETASTSAPATTAATQAATVPATTEATEARETFVTRNGSTYYVGADGEDMKLQTVTQDGKSYYLDREGKLVTDRLVSCDGYLYTADSAGVLTKATGWHEQDGRSYYGKEDGSVYASEYATIDDEEYFMDQYGAVLHGTPTIDQYLGSRHLLYWMETHFNDYYFKTPYDGIWTHLEDPEALLRPYGEYGENGGMNCSGFISHLIRSTGGDLKKVDAMGMEGGFIDADSYLYLGLREYVQCRTYDSVEELLASGDAKKGDIMYLFPDKSENEDADCHLGIFWGDTSSENKFWSQAQDTGCGVTEIRMLNPIKKIYLFPISEDVE